MSDITFDFITDDRFRASLDSDYRELTLAMEHGSWKAAHVLAGSIVEAVLIDYLLDIGYNNMAHADILSMDLNKAILACKSAGVLSQRVVNSADAIRSYRNLIHPGRVIRLEEPVDEDGAGIAHRLVRMIIKEITDVRKQKYGYTAEQIVAKLEADPSVGPALLEHMLKEVKLTEKRRLLMTVLPRRLVELEQQDAFVLPDFGEIDVPPPDLTGLEKGFRVAFDTAPDDLKTDVVARFVFMLKEEGAYQIAQYERVFFRSPDLAYCSPEDTQLIKEHLLVVLPKQHDERFLAVVAGLSKYLGNEEEVEKLVDGLMRMLQYVRHFEEQKVVDQLYREWLGLFSADFKLNSAFIARVKVWIRLFETGEAERQRYAELLMTTMGIKKHVTDADSSEGVLGDEDDEDIPF